MGARTGIEWCDSTLNLQMGCDGCELWNEKTGIKKCYAGKLTERYAGFSLGYPEAFTKPKLFTDRLAPALKWADLTGTDRPDKPWLNGYPRTIFLNDMGDTFTESLPPMWLGPHVASMAARPHVWIILTKRPGRMLQFWQTMVDEIGPIPPNFWLLTSVTGPENVNRVRELLKLRALGAKVLGASYEPAWGAVNWAPFVTHAEDDPIDSEDDRELLDWLIAGGESGSEAKPAQSKWFTDARDACEASGTPYFFKQWGEWLPAGQDGARRDPQALNCGDQPERVGKKAAGALLDGREWREMPKVAR